MYGIEPDIITLAKGLAGWCAYWSGDYQAQRYLLKRVIMEVLLAVIIFQHEQGLKRYLF
jgi:hypothetical protein